MNQSKCVETSILCELSYSAASFCHSRDFVLVHPVRTNLDIFETAYFLSWIGPLTTQSQWFRSFIHSLLVYKMCGFKYIRIRGDGALAPVLKQRTLNGIIRWVRRKKKKKISDFDFSFRSYKRKKRTWPGVSSHLDLTAHSQIESTV